MNRPRVLLVDDDASIRRFVALALEELEVDLVEVPGVAPAREALAAGRFDLIITDLMMPGETRGLDLCLALKVEPMLAATRVIMLSARGTHADREAGLRAGADAYLVKPFSPMQLLALVDDETVAA